MSYLQRVFHSEEYLGAKKKKGYFEGWYFKQDSEGGCFSVIVGVSKCLGDSHSFVQVIMGGYSGYFRFSLEDFSFNRKLFIIKIGGNYFSRAGISLNLNGEAGEVLADIRFTEPVSFKKSLFSPSAMGPLSYLPMPCCHGVISLSHRAEGKLYINGRFFAVAGRGYIEKDYGSYFPGNYVWMQGEDSDVSVMLAAARFPLNITGFICLIRHGGRQHNLSLYTGTRIKRRAPAAAGAEPGGETGADSKTFAFTLKRGRRQAEISAELPESASGVLIAPVKGGRMEKKINENTSARINVRLTGFSKAKGKSRETEEFTMCGAAETVGD